MLNIAVVEDDIVSAQIVHEHIQRYAREHDESILCKTFPDGSLFIEQFEQQFDLILLDIEMPHMNGMDVAHEVRSIDDDVVLIFITNMAQYAIQGYSVRALSYLLKPVNYYAFAMELEQAVQLITKRRAIQKRSIILSVERQTVRLGLDEIRYVESRLHNLIIHTSKGVLTLRKSMNAIEEEIHDSSFARCNVSFLVNLAHVNGITADKQVIIDDGSHINISRQKYKGFMSALLTHYGSGQDAHA
ncbi:LytR/AlgR family response regulator transcription factor [Bifidobacterium tsurumiense]|uniref:Putative DNA-binding response regulator n=1 Tax=Bifidobacterium tsurumiense TaxID=356829 RepID=A0A087EK77_9BIFI|nr:LytTR family DNA-binding domain-containing protein [Bifidobacterium tsurumiense]KFJ08178.1 putative DNA-binding response regulator [Bifidobacterium tsurumiense]